MFETGVEPTWFINNKALAYLAWLDLFMLAILHLHMLTTWHSCKHSIW